ncbi:unnamed protein product [Caenorhabditis auriculariae]|uniref:Uncharacterized protein n=1 Tax=Caenorhabditis auriculariae TaxID=2777116 RepID=A0A8S1HC02_9PELO|nr:unnamed protein product [Caenorhabditis auriculariae]
MRPTRNDFRAVIIYISCIYWSFFMQPVILLPFPGGVLLLFAVYPSILFYLCQTSNRDSVAYNYPHLTWIFSIENLKVYKWNIYFHVYIIGLIVGIALASVIFIATVVGIQYEITAQGQQLSSNMRSYHMKTLRNLFLQTSVTGLFCGVAPMMLACCAVVPNDTDTRVVIIIACSTFGGASIASTCSMIGLNETYRSYILKFFASKVHKKENKTTGNSRVSHVFLV